jgi:putative SOS response-associated peptidase YedK
MCGRYALFGPQSRHRTLHPLLAGVDAFPGVYNVAPSLAMPVARMAGGRAELITARWGLVPCWARDWKTGPRMINARAETLRASKAYGAPFRRKQRCLVPASGFYEWRNSGSGKQPYFVTAADGELLAFAGLWEEWRRPGGEPLISYTIVTGPANALVAALHERMPVILDPADYERWLTADDPLDVLRLFTVERLRAYPVSTRVNRPGNDDAALVEPLPASD